MKVFLLRHAIAAYGGPDPDRPLTPEGEYDAEFLAKFTSGNSFYDFSEIWCSPYLRARQTAEPFLRATSNKVKLEVLDSLTPFGDPIDIVSKLIEQRKSILIVGHNPHLSILARTLLGMEESHVHLPFKKSGLMTFKRDQYNQTGYSLSAYITPKSVGII
jgi:phosphohistidine phosphatase